MTFFPTISKLQFYELVLEKMRKYVQEIKEQVVLLNLIIVKRGEEKELENGISHSAPQKIRQLI